MEIFQWIISAGLIAYGVYTIIHSIKLFKADKQDSETFMRLHPEAVVYKKGGGQSLFLIILGVFGIFMAFSASAFAKDLQETLLFQITYLGVGVVFLGLSVEVYLKQILYVGDNNFHCAGNTYKFKSIVKIENAGSIFKKKDIYLQNGEYLRLPAKLGIFVEEGHKQWRIQKKKK